VRRILITGMSGTGKSSVIRELASRGYAAIDTDDPGWCVPVDGNWSSHDSDWLWDEDRMTRLLDAHAATPLFVSGCRPNQGRFYDRFGHIVLLTAPLDVMLDRVTTRTTNPFGSRPEDREAITRDKATVEPLLRRGADIEIDTSTVSLDEVVAMLIALANNAGSHL